MSAVRIPDLAEAMIALLAPEYGRDPSAIDTEIIGRRPGETLHEEIMTTYEMERALQNESAYAMPPKTGDNGGYLSYDGIDGFDSATDIVRSSEEADFLTPDKIRYLFGERGIVEALT